jgi:flavodoxin
MNRLLIVNNSLAGNSARISKDISEKLNANYEISIGNIRKMKPEGILKDKPDILLVGARIIAFRADRKIRNFVKWLGSQLDISKLKVGVFYTHGASWKEKFSKKMDGVLKDLGCIDGVCPRILEVKVLNDDKGILEDSYEQKLEDFIQNFSEFIGN